VSPRITFTQRDGTTYVTEDYSASGGFKRTREATAVEVTYRREIEERQWLSTAEAAIIAKLEADGMEATFEND
jgi:hypothetical protein